MAEQRELIGWIVIGFINGEPSQENYRKIPVVAPNDVVAMLAAAKAVEGFRPVGAMSESEVESHLQSIRKHKEQVLADMRRGAPQ